MPARLGQSHATLVTNKSGGAFCCRIPVELAFIQDLELWNRTLGTHYYYRINVFLI